MLYFLIADFYIYKNIDLFFIYYKSNYFISTNIIIANFTLFFRNKWIGICVGSRLLVVVHSTVKKSGAGSNPSRPVRHFHPMESHKYYYYVCEKLLEKLTEQNLFDS